MSKHPHPDEVLASILEGAPRPQKARNLRELHVVCQALYQTGPRDFSIGNVGKICEAKGIFKGRGLYNESAADYRRLISAWSELAGPLPPKLVDRQKSSEAYVAEINDPVLRMLVTRDLARLTRVTAELNLLKAQTNFVIDKRPVVERAETSLGNRSAGALEEFEEKALRKALAPEAMKRRGWQVTSLGEVVNESGRTIFEPGFATGLKKLIGDN